MKHLPYSHIEPRNHIPCSVCLENKNKKILRKMLRGGIQTKDVKRTQQCAESSCLVYTVE